MMYMKDSEGVPSYTGPSGVPRGPQKSPLRKFFSKKYLQKGGQNNRKLPNLPRSKVLLKKFFFQKLRIFLGRVPPNLTENFFGKMFSERGVKSTGNDLICQDTKPWKQLFFSKLCCFFLCRMDGPTDGPTDRPTD